MHYRMIIGVCVIFLITSCACLGISSKLDFGDSPRIIGSRVSPIQHRSIDGNKKDFDGIGVVCVSGGCNSTKSTDSTATLQADVIVHVETKLNKSDKPAFVDETPDVPVIVGVAGSNLDRTIEDEQPINQEPYGSSESLSHQNPSLIYTPTYSTNIPTRPLGSRNPSLTFTPNYSGSLGSRNPSLYNPNYSGSSGSSFRNPSLYTPSYSGSLSSQSPSLVYTPTYPTRSGNEYQPQAQSKVDINIKTLPPVTITMDDRGRVKDISYKSNGLELRIPYFEPTFNNHYFGEHPPPQLLWYPKSQGGLNPVEFKTMTKPTWNPSFWANKFTTGTSVAGDSCQCKNQPSDSGLQWHPNRRVYQNHGDPGSQINDKLAPLN